MTPPLDDHAIARLRAAADEPDLSGTRYTMVRRLASGGMGTVYLVRDDQLEREVALKVLSAADPSGELAARLLAEARHLARLEHPNIVPVHDAGVLPDGRPWYAMRLVRGMPLEAWRRETPSRPAMLRLFQKLCEAVAFAHARGIIHRDLKPDNIMVGAFGEALVLDWGVALKLPDGAAGAHGEAGGSAGSPLPIPAPASPPSSGGEGDLDRETQPGRLTRQGAVIGTPAYMSPEQAEGAIDRVDARTDVHALGAILYYLLAGRAPFSGDSAQEVLARVRREDPTPLRQIDRAIPAPLASIGAKAMAREAASRYASAQELADDIARYLDGLPVSAHPEGPIERLSRLLARHRTLVLLVAAYLVIRVVILAIFRR